MSINGALQIGQSAILASQAAIQVAGNNMANASTPGYHRQIARLSPSRPEFIGRAGFIGTGVQLSRIVRSVDSALQSRTRSAISDQNAAEIDSRFLNAIESVRNELTSQDLSSRLSAFFNSFSARSSSSKAAGSPRLFVNFAPNTQMFAPRLIARSARRFVRLTVCLSKSLR